MFMGISVAIAALGSALAFIAKAVGEMSASQRVTALVVVLVVLLGPIVLAGVLKLLRQDMGPIIEGCGWAVNKSMRLTRKLRRQFTLTKAYPDGAEGTPAKRAAVTLGILVVLLALAIGGYCWNKSYQEKKAAEQAAAVENAEPAENPVAEGDAPAAEAVEENAEAVADAAASALADVAAEAPAAADAAPAE
jgi:hypothetical protein